VPYDVFICHASEDKADVARPLAAALKQRRLHVWFDEMELQIGDKLREKVDEGIRLSRYGVVILSPNFFAKNWPKWELDGLADRELSGGDVVVLPVWHKIGHDEVASYSPSLANKVAAQTSQGIRRVADQIADRLRVASSQVQESPEETERKGLGWLRRRLSAEVRGQRIRKWIAISLSMVLAILAVLVFRAMIRSSLMLSWKPILNYDTNFEDRTAGDWMPDPGVNMAVYCNGNGYNNGDCFLQTNDSQAEPLSIRQSVILAPVQGHYYRLCMELQGTGVPARVQLNVALRGGQAESGQQETILTSSRWQQVCAVAHARAPGHTQLYGQLFLKTRNVSIDVGQVMWTESK
jgi:hypothetical protein